MKKLNKEELYDVAILSKLQINEEEVEGLLKEMEDMVFLQIR